MATAVNNRWSQGVYRKYEQPKPAEFDELVKELKLRPEQFVQSEVLREWAKTNRNYRYIPENLLAAWHLEVEDRLC